MLRQLVIGGLVSFCNISIHALVMTIVVAVARRASVARTPHPGLRLTGVMIAAVSVLMGAHTCEVMVWSLAYFIVGAASVPAEHEDLEGKHQRLQPQDQGVHQPERIDDVK
jgi:hypothetical protein